MPVLRWIPLALAAAILTVPLAATSQKVPIPPEVVALFDDIHDIDKLRVINPLKLTPEQVDRLIAAVQTAEAEYNRALADAAVPPIRQIAKEIEQTRQAMLAGASVPADFDAKVKTLQEEFVKRRDSADKETLKSLSAAIRKALTEEQVKTAISLVKKATADKDGKPTLRGTDESFFHYYVLHVFVKYPRIVPLLRDIKKAQAASGDSGR